MKSVLRIALIDDEVHNTNLLSTFLRQHCPEVSIVGTASSAAEARTVLYNEKPDAIFLDIHMPGEDGFDLLRSLPDRKFAVVFVTAFDKYAINAIKAGALDYLMKPIDTDEMTAAVRKLLVLKEQQQFGSWNNYNEQIQVLLDNVHDKSPKLEKISVPLFNGYQLLKIQDIIRCQSDNNYTTFFLASGKPLIISKSIKEYEELLEGSDFVRIHRSHLINMHHVEKFIREDNGYVIMSDKSTIEVSRRKKEEFIERLQSIGA